MQNILRHSPNLDKQTLFETSVYYNRLDDVTYLLKNFKTEIDISANNFYCLKHISFTQNLNMFKTVLTLGISKQQFYVEKFLKIACFIPFIITYFKIQINKKLIIFLFNVACNGKVSDTFKFLIDNDIQDFVSDYNYLITASGAGRNDILEQFIDTDTLKDVIDECIEIAIACKNLHTVEFLKKRL